MVYIYIESVWGNCCAYVCISSIYWIFMIFKNILRFWSLHFNVHIVTTVFQLKPLVSKACTLILILIVCGSVAHPERVRFQQFTLTFTFINEWSSPVNSPHMQWISWQIITQSAYTLEGDGASEMQLSNVFQL